MGPSQTIAAIATPPGQGGVGILRVSGDGALSVLRRLVPDWPDEIPSHLLRLSRIVDPHGDLIDEALAVIMKGPRSFTGEDVVELQCHGGPIILRRVLDAALAAGARVAEPGEFTRRAFLNGRLDLTQAEAVADLINATSESAHKLALEHLQGTLGDKVAHLVEELTTALVLVEAAIDFSHEEHVYQIEAAEVGRRVDEVTAALRDLKAKFDQGRRQREGVRVVILGPTNAGKSTLFNALHGTDRAIVTDVAGTTRDFLEEELLIGGAALRLVDTAGLRRTTDTVESIGIARSRELAGLADLILWVVDGSQPLDDETRRELSALSESGQSRTEDVVVLLNKADLPAGITDADRELLENFSKVHRTALGATPPVGLDSLIQRLVTEAERLTSGEGVLLSRARHLQGVTQGLEALARVREALDLEMEHELLAIDLREALDALGAITGRVSTDDVLARIFSEFCVGK